MGGSSGGELAGEQQQEAFALERAVRERPTAGPGDGKGGAFDAANGRDHRNFPPDPQVQFQRMKLALRFEDMTSGRFTGTETLTIAPIGVPVQVLRLDAVGMKVSSVTVDGRDAEFSNDGEALSIRFAQPLVPAVGVTVASGVILPGTILGIPLSGAWTGLKTRLSPPL